MSKRRIQILYFKAGGGHVNAKNALVELLSVNHPDWIVEPVDLYDILASVDLVSNLTQEVSESEAVTKIINRAAKRFPLIKDLKFKPFTVEDLYNFIIKEDMAIGLSVLLPLLQAYIKSRSKQTNTLLHDHFRNAQKPDMVVSVVPNYNLQIGTALKSVFPDVPYVTLMTDMVDLKTPFDFWMAKQDQHLICGTPEAYRQATTRGYYAPENIHLVSGMILRQSFYEQPVQSLRHVDIGLDPAIPTLAIMFGGNGSSVSSNIVRCLNEAKLDVQTIIFCGKNERLHRELTELVQSGNLTGCYPVGFTDKVAQLLRLSQFFIGKPGPASISEAVKMGCVVITARKRVMPQEAFNLKFIKKNRLGVVIDSFEDEHVLKAVRRLIVDYNGPKEFQRNIAAFPLNKAPAEIVEILGRIAENQPDLSSKNQPTPHRPARIHTRNRLTKFLSGMD